MCIMCEAYKFSYYMSGKIDNSVQTCCKVNSKTLWIEMLEELEMYSE